MTGAGALETKIAAAALATVGADGVFTGHASLFDRVDLGRDRVRPGAFAASLARRGAAGLRMLWQHDAAEPIGVWLSVEEDATGLLVRGQLALDVARAREAMALMRQGALDGLSIGFRTARSRTDAKTGIRDLIEIDLWEISLVTFPMLPEARVTRPKAVRAPEAGRVEALLRRAARRIRPTHHPKPRMTR
jgi:HK97 family phage prohead protease